MDCKKTNSLQRVIEKLTPMSWPQRLEYIWSYHKETIVISAAMLVIAIYLLTSLIANQKQLMMGGLIANVHLSEAGKAYLSQEYLAHIQGNAESQKVELTTVELGDMKNAADLEYTYYSLTKSLSLITDRKIDYLLMDKTALEQYMAQGVFLDLREVLSAELVESMNDRLIKLKPVDENGKPAGGEYPVAIDISELPFIRSCTDGQTPVYFGVAANSPNLQTVKGFWDYLNAWEEVA